MPFLAPVIAGAIGAGVVGQALIGIGVSVALAAAARALGPKETTASAGGRGMRLSLRLDPNAPRDLVFGTAAVAGTLVYHHVFGPNGNDSIDLVFAVADHECDALVGIVANGVALTWDSGTGLTTEYGDTMKIVFHGGADDQAYSGELVAESDGLWTTAHRGRGVAYVHVRMTFNQDLYPSGVPKFLFLVRGAKLYDWRRDSTAGGSGSHRWNDRATYEWSDNPAVILYNYRRGIVVNGQTVIGMNTPSSAMPVADWTSAANVCDESVALLAGGTEPRYRASGVVSSSTTHRDVISDLLTSMAGREISSGGIVRPLPGAAQAAVMTMTDDDLMADGDVSIKAKTSRAQLVNSVFGSFHDPAQMYESVASPPRISPADEADDGSIRLAQSYALDYVTSGTQAQRILEILRRRARAQMEIRLKLRPRYGVLEAGDWITWTSVRYGYTAKTFEVVSVAVGQDWSATVLLRETSSDVYTWVPAIDELDPANPHAVSYATPTIDRVSGLTITAVTIAAGDAQRPGIHAAWAAITDRTVTEIVFQYRKFGETDVIEYRVLDPSSGQATWLNGVLGNTVYEVRALPVIRPERPVQWTAWVEIDTATPVQVVEVAAGVVPGSIGVVDLDAQSRFELSLVTGVDAVLGSAGNIATAQFDLANRAAEEALRAALRAHDVSEAVRVETVTRQTESESFASQITTVGTTLAGHTSQIATQQASINGMAARWAVVIDIDGNVVGSVRLDGSASSSVFTVTADTFQVALPSSGSGAAVPVFAVGTVDGVAKLALRGDMLIDGSVLARHLAVSTLSAIAADIGDVTAGVLRSSDNKFIIDLTAKTITMRT